MFDITDDGWLPHRGDYDTEYATQLLELVETHRCSHGQGCTHAGTPDQIAEHGPGGACPHLAELLIPARCRVLKPGPLPAPACTAYEQRPLPTLPGQEALPW